LLTASPATGYTVINIVWLAKQILPGDLLGRKAYLEGMYLGLAVEATNTGSPFSLVLRKEGIGPIK